MHQEGSYFRLNSGIRLHQLGLPIHGRFMVFGPIIAMGRMIRIVILAELTQTSPPFFSRMARRICLLIW